MKKVYEFAIIILNIPRLIPILLLFYTLPKLKQEKIRSDLWGGNIFTLIKCLSIYKHWRNIFYYRLGNIKYFIKWICPEEHSIQIPVSTPIGDKLILVHAINSFLNAERIGDNFTCYQNVTIGSGKQNKRPRIGNNVTIYTSAIVIGDINIGDNVKIGAGAVVVKDVPNNCTVVGNPAKTIRH